VSEEGKRRNLGRGLSALFGEETQAQDYAALDKLRQVKMVPIEFLQPGRFQPRRHFDEATLGPLIDSVREKGVLQPLLVRRIGGGNQYEIVAGERRWRAAQAASLHEVPVVIRDFDDREALEVALVENIQRQDLTPLEEAEGYKRLLDEFGHTQEALAQAVGKSRSHVANMLRLLTLPDAVKTMLDDGRLSAGHARALLVALDPVTLAHEIVDRGLNVRTAEVMAQAAKPAKPAGKTTSSPPSKDADTKALERDLTAQLGLKVAIDFGAKGGSLTIHYRTLDQLDDVLRRLQQTPMQALQDPIEAEEEEGGSSQKSA
jgi:ParB family transcriptional regulator, chromosome partitioning protein